MCFWWFNVCSTGAFGVLVFVGAFFVIFSVPLTVFEGLICVRCNFAHTSLFSRHFARQREMISSVVAKKDLA